MTSARVQRYFTPVLLKLKSRKEACLKETPPKPVCQFRTDLTVLSMKQTLETDGKNVRLTN